MTIHTTTDCAVLAKAISRLEDIILGASTLSTEDEDWLSSLKEKLETSEIKIKIDESDLGDHHPNNYVDLLSVDGLSKCLSNQSILIKFIDGLKAVQAAEFYNPAKINLGKITLTVHNEDVGEYLKSSYSPMEFQQLYDFALAKDVFQVNIDPKNGLLQTSAGEENKEMSERRWVTDTIRCRDIELHLAPKSWRKAILTLATFYNQPEELQAMTHAIADPDYYRQGGLTNGVAHIFMPQNFKRDLSWFNNKRLESHALALKSFCDELLFESGKLTMDEDTCITIAKTISNLASYLKSINTDPISGNFDFAAPSAGPWEEIPFPDGLTWDTVATYEAFASLRNLLFETETPKNLDLIHNTIANTQYGAWLKDRSILDKLIASANEKIISRLFSGDYPIENPSRPTDISLAFISTSTIKLADDIVTDVSRHFQILTYLENNLVRDNGAIRYAPFFLKLQGGHTEKVFDSYLADNYWLFPELRAIVTGQSSPEKGQKDYGSADCSSEEDYTARVKLARDNTEAEWCWVSVMAEGYAKQTIKLLDSALASVRTPNQEEWSLIKKGKEKATEFINRSYARITATNTKEYPLIKSNGKECAAFAVPEAYEYVSPLNKTIKQKALPGVNTPLAWAVASLFSASQQFKECLEKTKQLEHKHLNTKADKIEPAK